MADGAGEKTVWKTRAAGACRVLAWLLAVSLYMAFNHVAAVGAAIVALLALAVLLGGRPWDRHAAAICAAAAVCLAVAAFAPRQSLRMAAITAVALLALANLVMATRARGPLSGRGRTGVILGAVGYAVSGLLFAALAFNAFDPDPFMIALQGGAGDYPADVAETHEELGSAQVFRDVTYESTYPNNTYTVYNVPGSKGVFFYIHGGGLVVGDKENDAQNGYLFPMMDAGYSVVTVDYALAPQNPFPQSVIEVNDALAHFLRHAGDYGLATDRVIVGGDSAGGMLSGLLACINTNPACAAELGVTPAVEGTGATLKGYVSISGLTDVPRFGETEVFVIDWIFDTMGRSAFQDIDYATSDAARLGSVLEHVTADFPPTYASDGNFGSFAAHNRDLVARLAELGVPTDSNFPSRDVATLAHIWDLDPTTEIGEENFERTVAFMDEHMR